MDRPESVNESTPLSSSPPPSPSQSLSESACSITSKGSSRISQELHAEIATDNDFRIVSITPSHALHPDSNSRTAGDKAATQLHSSESLSRWVSEALELRETHGLHFTENLRKNARFQNPAICAKMIAYCDLDEYGTNFPENALKIALEANASGANDSYSREGFYPYYDVLAERQREMAEKQGGPLHNQRRSVTTPQP